MTQNIIITGNRHSQKHINIMEMDPYNSKTANLLHEYDTKNNTSYFKFNEKGLLTDVTQADWYKKLSI